MPGRLQVILNKIWENILNFRSYLNKHPALSSILVFAAVFVFYGYLYFPNPGISYLDDHFFHFKYAYLMRTEGWSAVKNFDWIYYSESVRNGTRGAVSLFNLAQIPFTYFKDLIFGLKVSDVFWASLSFSCIYYIFRKSGVKFASLAVLMILSSNFMIARLMSGRPLVFSIALLFFIMYFATEKKYFKFFLFSLLLVLWHTTIYFMPLLIAGIVEASRYLKNQKINLANLITALLAVIMGLAFLPDFPSSLWKWTTQIFGIFNTLVGKNIKGEGIELYPVDFMTRFVSGSELFLLMSVFSVIYVIYYYISTRSSDYEKDTNPDSENSKSISPIMIYALFVFLLVCIAGSMLVTGRFFDYYIPTSVFLVMMLATLILEQKKILFEKPIQKILQIALFSFFVILASINLINFNLLSSRNDYRAMGEAARWVESKSNPKELVFLHSWGDYPVTFFYNDKNVYTMGLEPKILLDYSPELYWKWNNIYYNLYYCDKKEDCSQEKKAKIDVLKDQTEEKRKEFDKENSRQIIESIRNDFKSRFIISHYKPFEDLLALNSDLIAEKFEAKSNVTGATATAYELK